MVYEAILKFFSISEILSLRYIPKPSEVKKWKERNEIAATELEQLTESYMQKMMVKMKC